MTKKLLVAFDPSRPEAQSSDFLVPIQDELELRFMGLKSGKMCGRGLLVFVGRDITENDIFAKLVDSGRKIDDVDRTLDDFKNYLNEIKNHRIGSVIAINSLDSGTGFELVKVDIET